MGSINQLPVIVQQTIENLKDESIPQNIRFNYLQNLENIRDCCDTAIKAYHKKEEKRKARL